jgi:hypothetical protein
MMLLDTRLSSWCVVNVVCLENLLVPCYLG